MQDNPALGSVPIRPRHTRLYRIRYKDLNRFIAIYWDPGQIHEVVLTLQRTNVFQRWYVTAVHQFNVCAYDFDCALISSADLQLIRQCPRSAARLVNQAFLKTLTVQRHCGSTGAIGIQISTGPTPVWGLKLLS